MTVPIKPEPNPKPPYEHCFSCRTPTKFWTDLPDRTPGEQVACCPGCACDLKPNEVITKKAWFERDLLNRRPAWSKATP